MEGDGVMIPLRDSVRSNSFPLVTVAIIGVNILAFLFEVSLEKFQLNQYLFTFGLIPAEVMNSFFTGEPIEFMLLSFITSMFLHGSWLHILGNMWYLWIFGDNIEDHLGHFRYFLFYLGTGFAAGMVHIIANPASTVPVIGASGAVAGVLGGYMVLFPRSRVLSLVPVIFFITVVEVPAVLFIGIWFLIQVFNSIGSLGGAAGTVAWWAHIGGFVAGFLIVRFLTKGERLWPVK